QLHGGLAALKAPVNTLASNWAYMVMTALAWNLKAWWALLLPVAPGRWQQRHREEQQWVLGLEFKTFVQAFLRLPCQIVRTGRKLVYRLLSWNPYQQELLRNPEPYIDKLRLQNEDGRNMTMYSFLPNEMGHLLRCKPDRAGAMLQFTEAQYN